MTENFRFRRGKLKEKIRVPLLRSQTYHFPSLASDKMTRGISDSECPLLGVQPVPFLLQLRMKMTRRNSEKIRVLLTRSRTFTTIWKKSGKLGNNPSAPNQEPNLYDFSNISRENSVKIRLRKSRTHGFPITGSDTLPLRSGSFRGSKSTCDSCFVLLLWQTLVYVYDM